MPRLPAVSGRILIVDDDERQRNALAAMLSDCDFDTQVAADGQEALERLTAFNADVIVADLVMPRMDGFELLRHLKERGDLTPAIVLTGFGSMEKALSAVHDLKAFWFLEKPVEPRAFKTLLERAIHYKRSLQKTDELKRDLSLRGVLGDLVGTSPAMQQIFSLIRQVAPTSAPVLICGESGTGKELVAREIHKCSPRADGPFVAINAAALPETLIESELFGHEKGAFTGAMERSAGCFEQADGGTLLLDEIGEMPPSTQPKLLRVLEDLRVRRLGGKKEIPVDARVLAATSQDLGTHLREELYYRLSVFQIVVPPLREHKEDIPPIADVMLQNLNKKHGTRVTGVDAEVLDLFHRYDWPGNVRELRNVLERATIMAGEGLIRLTDLPSPAFGVSPGPYSRPSPGDEGPTMLQPGQPLMKLEEAYIKLTLDHVRRQSQTRRRDVGDQPADAAEPDRRTARRGEGDNSRLMSSLPRRGWRLLKALPRVFRQASSEWINDNAPRLGASVAFYTLLSLAPVIVLAVAVAAVVYGQEAAQGRFASEIQGVAGPEVARTIQELIRGAYQPRTGVIATLLGLATLVFGASSVFVELHDAMNTIWHVSLPPDRTNAATRHSSDQGSLLFVRDGAGHRFPAAGFSGVERLDRGNEDRCAAGCHVHDFISGNSGAVCGPLQNRSGR